MAVADFQITRRFAYADGREFGKSGAYEQIDGILTFGVIPSDEVNRPIVDLELAPANKDGKVTFHADLSIIKPVDSERGSNRLLVELPNRGRRTVVDTMNRTGEDASASPAAGDGFLFERGLTVASIGWQWDVFADNVLMGLTPPNADLANEPDPGQNVVEIRPNSRQSTWLLADRIHKPLRTANLSDSNAVLYIKDFEDDDEKIVPRGDWSFARETENGVVPSDQHIYLKGGFQPGKYYQVVYSTKDSPVVGSGLLALRDTTAFLKYDSGQFMPYMGRLDHAIGYGTSQTGRMLRHFLFLGLNIDEAGRKVFDGLLPHVAGGRVGAFNHRYAQPSNQSYPSFGHLFPFADTSLRDPLTGKMDGLFTRLNKSKSTPKVIYTNSSSEYWRGDCSLIHTDPAGQVDIEIDKNSRVYHFAGTQHGAGSLPQSHDPAQEDALGLYPYNVVDYSPLLRAAFVNLEKWITEGVAPPPSKHPRIKDKTAVTRDAVLATFDQFPDQVTPARSKLWVIRTIDLGNHCEIGVGSYPPREGESYNCLVSAVDEDGNEVAGIHLPDISRPIASHSGWNVRDPGTGSPDQQVPMLGFSRWFANTKADRYALGDPRLSINERYQNRDNYADLVRADAEKLVSDGYLLESDVEIVVCNAMERYNAVARKHAAG